MEYKFNLNYDSEDHSICDLDTTNFDDLHPLDFSSDSEGVYPVDFSSDSEEVDPVDFSLDSEVLNSVSFLKEELDFTISMEGKNPSQIPSNQTPITKPGILSSIFKDKETSNK